MSTVVFVANPPPSAPVLPFLSIAGGTPIAMGVSAMKIAAMKIGGYTPQIVSYNGVVTGMAFGGGGSGPVTYAYSL